MVRDEDFPRPVADADSEPFWRYCQAHELRIQRCTQCDWPRHYPRPRCPRCQSAAFEWARCRGTGVVASFTICYPPVLPAFADRVPYNVVVVELAEGPFIVSNLIDHRGDPIVGMAVEVCFIDVDDELTIPQFRPLVSDDRSPCGDESTALQSVS